MSLLPSQNLVVLICDFLLTAAVYVGVLFLIGSASAEGYLLQGGGWVAVLVAVGSVLGGLYFNELYTALRVKSRVALALELSHVFGLSLVLQTLMSYLQSNLALPRGVVLVSTALGFPALYFWRLLYSSFLWNLFGRQSVLLVGDGELARDLAREIADRPDRGFALAGYVGDPVPHELLPARYLGPFEYLVSIAAELKPDRIVVACPGRGGADDSDYMPVGELLELRHRGMPIEDGVRTYENLTTRMRSADFRPAQFIFDNTMVHRPGSLALQSIYINLIALASLIVFSPVLVGLSILVAISTGGAPIEQVPCAGYRGIPFELQRFRIARVEGNRVVLTGLGRFLHRYHLDLLPALFNLLRGEMAFVGPRPCRPEVSQELALLIPFYEQRYAMKPGLTGWSQINMDTPEEPTDGLKALEYDLYYLKNMSLSLDAYILLHRVRNIFTFSS